MCRPATVSPVDPLSLTREQRRDRDAVRGGLSGARICWGWESAVLAWYDVPAAKLEAVCADLEAIGSKLELQQQDPAAIKRFARKLGATSPDLLLRLLNAISDIAAQDRPAASLMVLRLR